MSDTPVSLAATRRTLPPRAETVTPDDRWGKHPSYGLPPVERTSSIVDAVAPGRSKPDAVDLRALDARC